MKLSAAHKTCISEFIGTFSLVLAGTGAIVINDVRNGVISHVGIALTFGLVVMAMIYTLGDISGAHLNPAVTFGFWVAKRFPGTKVFPYMASQCAGALSASAFLHSLFPRHSTLGATIPTISQGQAFVLETILSFFLMLTIINVSEGSKEKGVMAGVAVGAVVALLAMFAGPVTGASMNPARSIGPAVVSGKLNDLWIYILAPLLGAYFAILGCKCIQEEGCCSLQS